MILLAGDFSHLLLRIGAKLEIFKNFRKKRTVEVSSLTDVHCFNVGYVEKQPEPWKE